MKEVTEILEIEEKRYLTAKDKSRKIIVQLLEKKEILDENKMTTLYESDGITPEIINDIAQEKDIKINVPEDFYSKISAKHMSSTENINKKTLDLTDVSDTQLLFRDETLLEFKAKVLKIIDGWVILDKTAFYAEAGGQDHDLGIINHIKVDDVQKFGDVIAHKLGSTVSLKPDMTVECLVDETRRLQLTQHHTAVHLINAAARKVLGNHIWQGGSGKSVDKAHLDITHHSALSEKEVDKIEDLANKMIHDNMKISKDVMPRQKAEAKYGMRIYQGGAVPDRELRIVTVMDGAKVIDSEACGGTHLNNTHEVEEIIVTNTERIQDGLVRITLVAGNASKRYRAIEDEIIEECKDILHCKEDELVKYTKELFKKWKKSKKEGKKVSSDGLENQIKGIINILDANMNELRTIAAKHKGIFFGTKDKSVVITMDGAGEIIKALSEIGVKGGGRDNFAQGKYEKEPKTEDIKKIKKLIGIR